MDSGASGRKRSLLPLPRTRSWASESKTSSGFKANTSAERSPWRIIKPTMARSRAVRKLDQKRATSSIDSGTIWRLADLTRIRLTDSTPHPKAIVSVVVGLTDSPPVADDRVGVANGAPPRQALQRNYPGSRLSF